MAFDADIFVKKLKQEKHSLKSFAAAIGVSTRTVSRWKNGQITPKMKDMGKIAGALNCSPQDLDEHFADVGTGEVPIHARVSIASHNAYQLMGWRYGVSQREIMELAPVLFAIVAGHALRVPEQDAEINAMARANGLPGTSFQGEHVEQYASERGKCFGLKPRDPAHDTTRNLFCEAMRRLSLPITKYVDPDCMVYTEPEDVPTAAGFILDIDRVWMLAGEDPELAQAIAMGRVHLSDVLQKAERTKGDVSAEDFATIIREVHTQDLNEQRQAGLKKKKAWRAFYAERHPEKAAEFDKIVAAYCLEEGEYPSLEFRTDEDRHEAWINPWREDRHLDPEKLQDGWSDADLFLGLRNNGKDDRPPSPIRKQFEELKKHRAEVRKLFEESLQ